MLISIQGENYRQLKLKFSFISDFLLQLYSCVLEKMGDFPLLQFTNKD